MYIFPFPFCIAPHNEKLRGGSVGGLAGQAVQMRGSDAVGKTCGNQRATGQLVSLSAIRGFLISLQTQACSA